MAQTPKEEGRGELLGLKRPYDVMEGGITRGLPLRDATGLSAPNCEGIYLGPCTLQIAGSFFFSQVLLYFVGCILTSDTEIWFK